MKDLFSNLVGIFTKSWWVEISTDTPKCVYYFGPFNSEAEAIAAKAGYIQDLEQEGAQQLQAKVSRREDPPELTVELPETPSGNVKSTLGSAV
ncbi:MAG: DUF1816 domain-containing protein [Cyanobacteria bacterium P01_A01_bin.114]